MKRIRLVILFFFIVSVKVIALAPTPSEVSEAYSIITKMQSNEEKIKIAKTYIQELDIKYPEHMIFLCGLILRTYLDMGDTSAALLFLQEYEGFINKTEILYQALEYQSIANTFLVAHQADIALFYAKKSIEYFETIKNKSSNDDTKYDIHIRICDSKCIIGKIYHQKKEYNKALRTFQEIINDKHFSDCYLWFYDYLYFLRNTGKTEELLREYDKIVFLYKESGTAIPKRIEALVTDISETVTDRIKEKQKRKGISDAKNALRREMKFRSCYSLAPDIIATTINSDIFRLSEKRGKVCVLVFWDPSCSYTIAAMRDINTLKPVFGEKIDVVNITVKNSSQESVEKVLNKIQTNGPVIIGDETLATTYAISGSGKVVVVDKNGNIRYVSPFYSPILAALIKSEISYLL